MFRTGAALGRSLRARSARRPGRRGGGRQLGIRATERSIAIDELLSAQRSDTLREVFGCGTASVIIPVGELGWKDETLVVNGGQPGELAKPLSMAITDIQDGPVPDSHGWMTPVG